MKFRILLLLPILVLLVLVPMHSIVGNISPGVSTPGRPEVIVTSHIPDEHEILYLPQNSSGLNMYPIWNISILNSGPFAVSANGKVLTSGSGPITVSENMSSYRNVNLTITSGGSNFVYHDISIIGLPPEISIYSVSVVSNYPGQNQFLAVPEGKSGELTYPEWNINVTASNDVPYAIYENGVDIYHGTILGSRNFELNATGNSTSVIVSLGGHIFNFKNELVAHVPVSRYYAPKPPALVYSVVQYELGIAKAFVASVFAIVISLFSVRRFLKEHRKREVVHG